MEITILSRFWKKDKKTKQNNVFTGGSDKMFIA